ncbi:MAG: hypothetical protein NVSMB2_09000 [Chloroflexota bacterium]
MSSATANPAEVRRDADLRQVLRERATRQALPVVCDGTRVCPAASLMTSARALQSDLETRGVRRGGLVLIDLAPGVEFVIGMLACIRARAVAVVGRSEVGGYAARLMPTGAVIPEVTPGKGDARRVIFEGVWFTDVDVWLAWDALLARALAAIARSGFAAGQVVTSARKWTAPVGLVDECLAALFAGCEIHCAA